MAPETAPAQVMKHDKLSMMVSFVSIVLLAAPCFAQGGDKQSCDVPLVVTRFDSSSRKDEMVRNLGPNDLSVQIGSATVSLDRISIDDSPKRVALILDASENVPDDEWKLEVHMASSFVEHARSVDMFALL